MVDEPRDRLLVRLGGSAPIGLAAFDAKRRYTAINDWLAQLNGASIEQHIGRTVREMLPMLADQLEPVMRAIFDGGEPVYGIPLPVATNAPGRPAPPKPASSGSTTGPAGGWRSDASSSTRRQRKRALARRVAAGRDHERDGRAGAVTAATPSSARARGGRRAGHGHRVRH
jgi:hypothetical protein